MQYVRGGKYYRANKVHVDRDTDIGEVSSTERSGKISPSNI